MKRAGIADLRLSGGGIPPWLFSRMKKLCLPIVESIVQEYGNSHLLSRLSNPYWFQSFGAVIGMDWNSSGVTTAIMAAMKASLNPHSKDLGIYICGGKGKESLKTPNELLRVGDATGMDGNMLARSSKLTAKVDNTALQDGFNLYLHSFVLSNRGEWTVIQQGMNANNGIARRYHWHSTSIRSFVESPHAAVCGDNQGKIINLVHSDAKTTRKGILEIAQEHPDKILSEIPHMKLPTYCDIKSGDVDMKRLGTVLWLANEQQTNSFEDLLLLKGLGPRTLQSLTLVSEVIHGTPSRFNDPARYSFAFGGKAGKPFPVPTKIYDETISVLKAAVDKAKIGNSDKLKAIKSLTSVAQWSEKGFIPERKLDKVIQRENKYSSLYGGKSISLKKEVRKGNQLDLF